MLPFERRAPGDLTFLDHDLDDVLQLPETIDPSRAHHLVVDLDGTLIKTDLLIETCLQQLRERPLSSWRIPLWLLGGRSRLKAELAQRCDIDAARLPYREALLQFLREQKQAGVTLTLATASHERLAKRVAEHLDLFDHVLATTAETNLKGGTKLQAIRNRLGAPFTYAGDSKADLPIWEASEAAIPVGCSAALTRRIESTTPINHAFKARGRAARRTGPARQAQI